MTPGKQDIEGMVPAVILPDGYRGKILLVLIARGEESMMALRSGDSWHREILRNTRAEMTRIGLPDARVEEMGGAHLSFETDGTIQIWGRSEEFGACDLNCAAALVEAAKPRYRVVVSEAFQLDKAGISCYEVPRVSIEHREGDPRGCPDRSFTIDTS